MVEIDCTKIITPYLLKRLIQIVQKRYKLKIYNIQLPLKQCSDEETYN
jgi:hypothetical protein